MLCRSKLRDRDKPVKKENIPRMPEYIGNLRDTPKKSRKYYRVSWRSDRRCRTQLVVSGASMAIKKPATDEAPRHPSMTGTCGSNEIY